MAEAKYKIIQTDRDVNTDQDEEGEEEAEFTDNNLDETVTIIALNESNVNYPNNLKEINIMQTQAAILALILIYLTLSIGLTFYQSSLLENFPYPFTVVLYHLLLKLVISAILRFLYKCFTGKSRIHIDFKKSFKKLSSTGVAAGIDVGFSNWGLKLVTISLYTMTKSTTIIFILFFAILFGLEKKSWSLMLIVVLISSGLCLFTYKSTQFNELGFCVLLIACLSSGIRWTFAQFIMQKTKLGLHNPIDMIYFMQPWMMLPILSLTIYMEGHSFMNLPNTLSKFLFFKLTLGALIAFALETSEFLVLSYTSGLTLSIIGVFKEICQLILAVEFKNDQMSATNLLGLVICLIGISFHVIHKFATRKPLQSMPIISEKSLTTSPTSYNHHVQINGSNGNTANNKQHHIKLNYFSAQNTPLLDSTDDSVNSDSEDSQCNHQNASEVIFDVLKRRDIRR